MIMATRSAAIGIRAHPFMSATRFTQRVADSAEIVRILDTASKIVRDDAEDGDRLQTAIRHATAPATMLLDLILGGETRLFAAGSAWGSAFFCSQ